MAESSNLPAVAQPTELGFLTNAIATFEGVQRLAEVMAKCGTMPAHLKNPADCFRIVVQAAKWGMDPFVVAECTSLVHGRLCYEGKLVAAALINRGLDRLDYQISGQGQASTIVVSGKPKGSRETRQVHGSVADWRTKDPNGRPNNWDKDPHSMLVYRGTRQWARLWAPEVMAGVYTPDELDDLREVEGTVVGTEPAPARTGEPAAAPPADPPAQPPPPAAPPHPAHAAANALWHKLEAVKKGEGSALMKRLAALHGAAAPKDVPADRLDAFATDVEKTIKAISGIVAIGATLGLAEEAVSKLEVDAQKAAREAAADRKGAGK